MMRRLITTLVGIPILVFLTLFAGIPAFIALILLVTMLAMNEYYGLADAQGAGSYQWLGYVIGAVILLSFFFMTQSFFLVLPGTIMPVLMAALFSRRDLKKALETTAFTIFGAWYVAGLLGYVIGIRLLQNGGHLVMMLLVIIWAGDIFAYLAGKSFGRHPLAAKASPKKTVEGSVAGFVFSIVAAVIYAHFLVGSVPPVHAAVLGGLIGIVGQIGDLCESLLKRSVDVKDSGALLPGHGGMLDRIDSLLFGAPAMYYYCYFVLNQR